MKSAPSLLKSTVRLQLYACFAVLLLTTAPVTHAAEKKNGERRALEQLGAYDPVYFILGENDQGLNAKFQVSFQYKLFADEGWVGQAAPRSRNFYLSYSQTSLWDLSALSGPFRDSSYRPRLFYKYEPETPAASSPLRSMEFGVGHESNGRAGAASRSISIVYIQPNFTFAVGDGHSFAIRPLIYAYFEDDENPDIDDYRGYADLNLSYSWNATGNAGDSAWSVWTILRKGTRSNYGSIEANIAAPLSSLIDRKMNGWLMLQYFNGYGESLLTYDRKEPSQARIGLAILF